MAAKRDYYEVLGVSRNATDAQIKSAYRTLAKQHHPDRNKNNPEAVKKFKEVQEAYEVLSDSKKRARYDQFGHAGVGDEGAAGPGGTRTYTWTGQGMPEGFDFQNVEFGGMGGGMGSILEELFGGRMGGRRSARHRTRQPVGGRDVEHEITLGFEQALSGTTVELAIDRGGRRETITARVPPGVRDGQRVRVRGKGEPGAGGTPGDLYLLCRVKPHRYFRRQGNDLYLDVPVTLAEAALGAEVTIPTLEGRATLKVPPGVASGTKLRLGGRGVRDAKTGQRGDEYAVVQIVAPKDLDDESRRLLEQLHGRLGPNPRDAKGWW